jgi:hypothetical protein
VGTGGLGTGGLQFTGIRRYVGTGGLQFTGIRGMWELVAWDLHRESRGIGVYVGWELVAL